MLRRAKQFLRLLAVVLLGACGDCFAEGAADPMAGPTESEKLFLDRLALAESGGRLYARNPASGAYGPFQFLSSTFLDVVRRNLPKVIEGKSDAEILNLRADAEVSRNAALIYTRENARYLAAHGVAVTAANLRMAFFVGPGAAVKVSTAKPEEPLANILSAAAIEANPILTRMTAAGLIERSTREAEGVGAAFKTAGLASTKNPPPEIPVHCNLKLPSCRKWLTLAKRRLSIREARLTLQRVKR
jgi:hypothetical protein